METWQSWFNAPDLKSDEGASPPGVRIPASPPVKTKPTLAVGFVVSALLQEGEKCEPHGQRKKREIGELGKNAHR